MIKIPLPSVKAIIKSRILKIILLKNGAGFEKKRRFNRRIGNWFVTGNETGIHSQPRILALTTEGWVDYHRRGGRQDRRRRRFLRIIEKHGCDHTKHGNGAYQPCQRSPGNNPSEQLKDIPGRWMDDLVDSLDDPGYVFSRMPGIFYLVSLRTEQPDTLIAGKLFDLILNQHPAAAGGFTHQLDIADENRVRNGFFGKDADHATMLSGNTLYFFHQLFLASRAEAGGDSVIRDTSLLQALFDLFC